jgi:hypothetical protein
MILFMNPQKNKRGDGKKGVSMSLGRFLTIQLKTLGTDTNDDEQRLSKEG